MFRILIFIAAFSLSTMSQAAFFENPSFSTNDPVFLKSLVLDTEACETEGYVVKFYGSSKDYKFCKDLVEKSRREYKKCVGREVGGYPFGRRCIGYRKTVVELTQVTVNFSDEKWTRKETLTRDGDLIHQEIYSIKLDQDQIELETSFINNDWNGSGEASYLFIKLDR